MYIYPDIENLIVMGRIYTPAQKRAIQKYHDTHRDEVNKNRRERVKKIKYQVIKYYSEDKMRCGCPKCDVSDIRFLTIDHMIESGSAHRSKLRKSPGFSFYLWLIKNKFPKGFQVLCFNCNIGKRDTGICPHLK